MAKTTKTDDTAAPENAEQMLGDMPDDFAFEVQQNVTIPATTRKATVAVHPWVRKFATMGHNDSFFVPTSYWIKIKGRNLEKTTFGWQADAVANSFNGWKKQKDHAEARKNLKLVRVARPLGSDPQYPTMAGVRCWLVDTTR